MNKLKRENIQDGGISRVQLLIPKCLSPGDNAYVIQDLHTRDAQRISPVRSQSLDYRRRDFGRQPVPGVCFIGVSLEYAKQRRGLAVEPIEPEFIQGEKCDQDRRSKCDCKRGDLQEVDFAVPSDYADEQS